MSTRSSIYGDGNSHVYHEISEPLFQDGQFVGYTIYACLSQHDLRQASLRPDGYTFEFYSGTAFAEEMGVTVWQVSPLDIEEVVYDAENDLILTIAAGSKFAKRLADRQLQAAL